LKAAVEIKGFSLFKSTLSPPSVATTINQVLTNSLFAKITLSSDKATLVERVRKDSFHFQMDGTTGPPKRTRGH
jgi:hypothetical protein